MLQNRKKTAGYLSSIACETLFGLSYVFTKQVVHTAGEFALLGWRFLFAFLAINLCVLFGWAKISFQKKNILPLIAVAFFHPILYFIGETIGIKHTSASESGAFLACIPCVTLLASSLFLQETPTKNQKIGIFITFLGVLTTVFSVGMKVTFSKSGYLMLTVAVLAYSLYSVAAKKASSFTSIEITYVMLFAGAVLFVPAGLLEGFSQNSLRTAITLPFTAPSFLLAVVYQGIGCSVFAFFLSNYAIAQIGVNRTASFIGLSTVVSIIAGIFLLNESFQIIQILGVILILAGVYWANILNE